MAAMSERVESASAANWRVWSDLCSPHAERSHRGEIESTDAGQQVRACGGGSSCCSVSADPQAHRVPQRCARASATEHALRSQCSDTGGQSRSDECRANRNAITARCTATAHHCSPRNAARAARDRHAAQQLTEHRTTWLSALHAAGSPRERAVLTPLSYLLLRIAPALTTVKSCDRPLASLRGALRGARPLLRVLLPIPVLPVC